MKIIRLSVLGIAFIGLAACCDKAPKQFDGTISDATMNTVTVKAKSGDATHTFTTQDADMTEANGLLLGAPVVVEYKGCLEEATPALKVATDPTYAEAIGNWTMPDPLDPEKVMGVEIMVEGEAQSINMATLRYNAWELQGEPGKIVLKGVSEGSGAPTQFKQTGVIGKNADGIYTLSIEGTDIVYTQTPLQ